MVDGPICVLTLPDGEIICDERQMNYNKSIILDYNKKT